MSGEGSDWVLESESASEVTLFDELHFVGMPSNASLTGMGPSNG